MDYSASDPPPLSFAPPSNMTTTPFSFSQPSNITTPSFSISLPPVASHTQPTLQLNHPPYEEMIRRAIKALNEKDGSSRQKIARYIENEFRVPPSPAFNYELTHNLKQMKSFGQLVLVKHSYMLPVAPPPQPQPSLGPYVGPSIQHSVQPSVGPFIQPSVAPYVQPSIVGPTVQPSVAPYPVSGGPVKRRPGRPPKLQPIIAPTPPSPMGFAAYSPKQSGVPTTNLFGGLTPTSYQFGAAPVNSVSSMGLITGPVNNASPANGVTAMTLTSGPLTNVSSTGPGSGSVSNVLLMAPVSGPMNYVPGVGLVSGTLSNVSSSVPLTSPINNVPQMGLVSTSVSNVSSISPVIGPLSYSGPVLDPVVLAKVGPSEQIAESAGIQSKLDSVMVGTGLESSAGPLVVSAANDPVVAPNNDGPLLVVSAGPDLVAQNNDGPTTVLGKRPRGRPPKINGGPKKLWGRPGMYVRKGRRGRRPKNVTLPISTMSLRPRGRPRKNAGGAMVAAVDGANGSGGGVLPVANVSKELPDRSLGRPNKDVPDTASLTSEIHLMAYQALKARIEHYHTRIKSVASVIRPCLNETEVIALGALQDLEDLTNMDIISVPVNAQSAPAYVRSAPVGDLNTPVTVQGAPVDDLNAPVNVEDAATENIQTVPSTAEDAQLTFQGTPSEAETAQLTFQSRTAPVQGQQESPLQS